MQTVTAQETPIASTTANSPTDRWSRICATLFAPVDISFLVAFRIIFGGIMLWEVYRYFTNGWISRYFVEPALYFPYYGFSWVKPWPGNGMYIHFYVIGVAAACVMAGFLYRIAAPVFFIGFTYTFLLDQTRYMNHFYLVCLLSFLMCFLPANRAFSIDALIRRKVRSDVVPAWTLWLLRIQVGIPYFYGGVAKLNSDWIHGGEPMRTWLRPLRQVPALGHILTSELVVYAFVFSGLLLDLLVVPLLLWRRTRPFAFVAAVAFNLINFLIFDIGIFPWLMLGALLIFFPPDLVRRLIRGVLSQEDAPLKSHLVVETSSRKPSLASQKLVVGVLAAWVAFQVLMPLRHYLYPGNVSWTEEGHNFAWHMKLRTKVGEAVFTITHPSSGQSWTINPQDYLKRHQVMKMITKPELILQFGQYLAEIKSREGFEDVEVRARVMVSLNGRQPQLMIDPDVDLTKEQSSLLPTPWIAPLTTPLEARSIGADSRQVFSDADSQ